MIFLVLSGKMIFFFPKIWSYTLDGKWKMIFFKKIHGNIIFSSDLLKIWSFQKVSRRHMIFDVLSGKMVFLFLKTWPFYPGQKAKHALSQEIHGNMMHRQRKKKKKKETWYLGSKFDLSLNLSGWRYSTLNNLQYLYYSALRDRVSGATTRGIL